MQRLSGKKTEKKRKRGWRLWLKIIGGSIALLLGACGILLGYLYMTDLPVSDMQKPSFIYDSQGAELTSLTSGQKQQHPVTLTDIAPDVIHATIATEDRQFYRHVGIDFKGIARAMLVNIESMSKKQGASTLTQQLARNLYLNHDRTWARKVKEAQYALQLEMKYSKDDILEQYLNQVYYGHGAYGIEAAAQLYFGKKARDLTLAESAILAGIPRGPSYYSPYFNMKNAKDRQKVVLQGMVETGYITQEQAQQAYNETLAIRPREERSELLVAPYFRDYVRQELDSLGISDQAIEAGGLRVYTTLDKRAQAAAEQAVAKYIPAEGDLQAALISIDPRNGYLKAMVGGKNYRLNQYNRVFANTRQPGSSFKPLVYLAALEKRAITAATHFISQPTSFTYDNGRQQYKPSNYGGKYYGEIDLRRAIAVSDNIYAVSTIMQIGPEQVISLARRLGIDSDMKPLPSLALGTFPVSPLEMAAAYGVFSNQGKRVIPRSVLKVTDSGGSVLYEAPPIQQEQVVNPADAYVLTSLMESVFETGGTGSRVATSMKRPVAGKTGTTDTDAWIVGYTPELSTAVWVGYDKDRMISVTESHKAAPIFAEYTEQALSNVPPKIFAVPDNVVSVYIDPDTGKLAGDNCPNKRLETFVSGTEPTAWCDLHVQSPTDQRKDEEKRPTKELEKRSWWQHLKRWWGD
ncbi:MULTISPECIES: transglycosylase domain-containing protein [Paenibacillus]|uniref:PBP1A family penicillin-binding protein n=1 Tax=Paenibacillus alvei TaxID=44250 RepID=A0ABT4ECJ3_PAEAL|nr:MULTISPECIES: PBP1A family penicillin-binding protein [Paenibacillus]EPY13551.1 penicillin-binding protein, 1A family [Paenibacillus alvei A6-6i-x]MCY9531465.1 PBP1A family penicillin-binding protein [Paenibacillus alvei]SDG41043.1 penicillin-binding protein 1B [Paenibacillus sp. cl6col]